MSVASSSPFSTANFFKEGGEGDNIGCHNDLADKKALRKVFRHRRKALRDNPSWSADGLIFTLMLAEHVRTHFGKAQSIAAYLPNDGEVDPLPVFLQAIEAGIKPVLPRIVAKDTPLHFHHWWPGDPLEEGCAGILQPTANAEEIIPDIILTPLVGFDRSLRRLGRGGGYYDRSFQAYPDAIRIGIAWSIQEAPSIPVDPWDIPLHAVATEKEWIGF
ncbi:MAG: 5-formyltetrahydrofolate cyclo-ligase [Zymomonas mobilis subsp. pomaceae]|uniref:5-formyltetrahydrofolate cyclo-ligase n=1 Tax=Zymomonas mobilis subsp. pomaceae (strain ATCC 29192 / DSM 22645 / JCM 10191 / CCUG 17912 / NBRC 13757 / NCIMB 11200 / NRRL B-4491 / Barker I) TaxID=579138 RepID=F8ESS4_ZYMMT|nr:5-formyltetrahydrofolate cyclo-ligase [Zymomonas mobilis]AEI37849.1 5-formyltetrahydrofolate cyclo-ligase [Zymomonas mobilis subsp. pomaceae ATCC 29192]MDX5949216.1 5-formyltetrahydrofolate cyclo-ligase [Zymomonas mobilis subsp. pomaceae]GEB89555.1 5-formyltetrahydrofolate cyclo-ligase [Zymomonas mobilis subsp. pomaceae]